MGELGIGITDLSACRECGHENGMIFQHPTDGWYVVCGYRKCEHKTEPYEELLDACSVWGLKEDVQ